jgi:RNA polymerase sigma-19 factor, ECF subfamily
MSKRESSFVENLATTCGEDLLRFLSRRVGSSADARDLAQEVYVRLLRLERKELIQNPQAYLYRVATNLLYEFQLQRRSMTANQQRWAIEPRESFDSISAERLADGAATQARLREVLGELSPKCRAVVVLHRRDGMTYDEIALELGISSSMVKKYLSAGLKHCRARLQAPE